MDHTPVPAPDGVAVTGPTAQLAGRLAGLHGSAIDAFARHAACRHLIDTTGAIIAGAAQEATDSVRRAYAQAGVAAGPVRMPGFTDSYDALHAAYLAGTACHGLELDDGYRAGSVHPGAVVVPAALALGFIRRQHGAALIDAVVAGYEATCRIAAAAHPQTRWRGFHNTGVVGVFGAAAAAAAMLGFDALQIESALGVAGSGAAGLFSFLAGGDVKRVHPGHAAREGLLAALLTEEGLPAPRGVLELKEGFFNAFAGGDAGIKDYGKLDILTAGDNNPQSPLAVANCYMKPYACCRHIHAAIDAVIDIATTEDLSPDQVERIDIGTYRVAASHAAVGWSDMTTAQMSFPFVIALALARRQVSLHDFGAADRVDPTLRAITSRIAVSVDPGCDADYPRHTSARVTLLLRDGRSISRHVDEPYGAAARPLSDAALSEKFLGLAAPVLGAARAQAALDALWTIDALKDLGQLQDMLAPA